MKNKNIYLGLGALVCVLLESFILFGFTGLKTVAGLLVLFILPAYMILDNFDLETGEKLFFSFFIGIGIFPLLVWYANRIVPSLRVSILITAIVVILLGLFLKFKKGKKDKKL